jgi:hypothetical protein
LQGPAPSAPGPRSLVRAGARYAHFHFPGHVPIAAAFRHVDTAVVQLPGWERGAQGGATTPAELVGHQSWAHRPSRVELLAVVAGFQPLVVSIGQRSEDSRVSTDAGLEGVASSGRALRSELATISRALRNVERHVHALGGWTVRDSELLGLVRHAQERFEWWVRAEHRVEELTPYLSHRSCPACRSWSKFDARWCRGCRHEFTAQDNFQRDDAKAAAEREIAALRADGIRAVQGGPPPPPPEARTAASGTGGGAWR